MATKLHSSSFCWVFGCGAASALDYTLDDGVDAGQCER